MWEALAEAFSRFPSQGKVARLLVQHGFRVVDSKILCGTVKINDSAIARAADVDRRVVVATVQTIQADPHLRRVFGALLPACNLKEVGPTMGWGVLELIPTSAQTVGIIAKTTALIAEAQISLRQIVIEDDPQFSPTPRAFIITEQRLPPRIVEAIRRVEGVEGVVLYAPVGTAPTG